MNLSKKQEEILNCNDPIIFVSAAAAGGKTNLLTAKVKQSIDLGKKVVAFTFTNMAAAELKSRIGVENNNQIFIGTIHSYCATLLFRKGIVKAKELIEEEKFDKLFKLISENPQCIEPIDICLCDEAQDSNEHQLKFIFELLKPKEYFIVYDLRQSIYRWAGAQPDLLKQYARLLHATKMSLNENYRNATSILDYARRIIENADLDDDSVPMRSEYGMKCEDLFSPETILEKLNHTSNYKDWAILTRTNNEIDEITHILMRAGIPYDTFKQGDLKREELVKRMESNTVKVLTIHSAKGLEWNKVMVLGARFYNDEEASISYVAATRARDYLLWLTKPKKKKKTYGYYGGF